jgi:ubiquitin C-terminal hydrolase
VRDTVGFAFDLIRSWRAIELGASRCAEWLGVAGPGDSFVTYVDHLFAFVEEERSRCMACGLCKCSFARNTVLRLPVPEEPAKGFGGHTLQDLYLSSCAKQLLDPPVECYSDVCSGALTAHQVQRRVVSQPKVLLVHLDRRCGTGALARCQVGVEEQ